MEVAYNPAERMNSCTAVQNTSLKHIIPATNFTPHYLKGWAITHVPHLHEVASAIAYLRLPLASLN